MKPEELPSIELSLEKTDPIWHKLFSFGAAKDLNLGIRGKIALLICVTWLPLVILSWWQGTQAGQPLLQDFMANFSESVRFLIVLPMLLIAPHVIGPWVTYIVRYFVHSGLIPESQMPRYREIIQRAQRRMDSVWAEILLLLAAYYSCFVGFTLVPQSDAISWRFVGQTHSMAYYWFYYISMPLFRFIWNVWFWRICLWFAVLFRISRLDLHLMPTHPDGRGGLGFISAGHCHLAILFFAVSCQISSVMAEGIIYHHHRLTDLKDQIMVLVLIAVIVGILPLALFTPKLIELRRKGLYQYGILAKRYVDSFHSKWIKDDKKHEDDEEKVIEADPKSQDNFKAVGNMQVTAFDRHAVAVFALATAAPFTPLLLTAYQLDQLLDQVVKKLF
jgi:hypothetical protein